MAFLFGIAVGVAVGWYFSDYIDTLLNNVR